MRLVDALPKNDDGLIVLSPGGIVDEHEVDGEVSPAWFEANFPQLAAAEVPLSSEQYEQLKSIDRYWKQNAEKWRAAGFI